mmetsp:Transcript_938/g.2002  ORF Transcript_938/g.2002 Transcript_938/m.2002 type:complete len:467 (+) Transcript_938:232-1632(+)
MMHYLPRASKAAVVLCSAALFFVFHGVGANTRMLASFSTSDNGHHGEGMWRQWTRPLPHSPLLRPPKRLALRGGSGTENAKLNIPNDFAKFEEAMSVINAGHLQEAHISFAEGKHNIGAEEYNDLAMFFERGDLALKVEGPRSAELSGHWRCLNGTGSVRGVLLLDVVKLAENGYHIDYPGDNCVHVEAGEWSFVDCEVQCSGTALRALGDARVLWERCVTGGSDVSKVPPSNISAMPNVDESIRQIALQAGHRDPETGLSLLTEAPCPKFGVSAWDTSQVTLRECHVINMTYNAVCGSGNTSITIQDCELRGSGMAAVYLEGDCKIVVEGSTLIDNYVCYSVWAGFGAERTQKTIDGMEVFDMSDIEVAPTSTLHSRNNRLHGLVWGGARPNELIEEGDTLVDDVEMNDDVADDEFAWYLQPQNASEREPMWDIHERITIPKWAPKDKEGGDGYNFWAPDSSDGD